MTVHLYHAVCGRDRPPWAPAPRTSSVTFGWSKRPHSTTCWLPGEGPGWSAAAKVPPLVLGSLAAPNPIQVWPLSGLIMSPAGLEVRGDGTPGLNPTICCAPCNQPSGSDPVFRYLLPVPRKLWRASACPLL